MTPGASTLRFGGVDYSCTVLVDGRAVARHEGLFRPFDVDLADVADGERHLLAVVVHPAPASEPQVGRTSRVRVHKPRMNYGWDFCPRLVHQGIWRSVWLCDGSPDPQPLVRLEDSIGTVEVDGEVVLRIEDPQLWWPNGLGEQHLYPVELGGRDVHVGFRTVELEPPEPGALPYAFVVNGVRMYVKGWNWCPLDALYGVPRRETFSGAESGIERRRSGLRSSHASRWFESAPRRWPAHSASRSSTIAAPKGSHQRCVGRAAPSLRTASRPKASSSICHRLIR